MCVCMGGWGWGCSEKHSLCTRKEEKQCQPANQGCLLQHFLPRSLVIDLKYLATVLFNKTLYLVSSLIHVNWPNSEIAWNSPEDSLEDTPLRGKTSLETNLPTYSYVYIQQVHPDMFIKM